MSGPNDSSAGNTVADTAGSDLKTPLSDATARQTLSPRYRLQMHWEPPRLQWGPALSETSRPGDPPAFLQLDDPGAAVDHAERYIVSGALLFGMRQPQFQLIDNAFLNAPVAPPQWLPSFAQMRAWEDDAFYKRLGRSPPLFGAPVAPAPLLTPPLLAPPPPSPFYKLPDPSAMPETAVTPKPGSVGDVLKALTGLKVVQDLQNRVNDEASREIRVLKIDWRNQTTLDRGLEITFAAPLAAGLVGAALGANDARHFAFNLLKGKDIPLPPVPGLSLRIDNFGKADPFLLGGKASDASQPVQIGLKFDLLKAIPALRKVF